MKYLGEGKPQYLELGGGGTSVGELRIQFSHLFILNLINMAKKIQYHLFSFKFKIFKNTLHSVHVQTY